MSAIDDIKKEIVQRHQVPISNNESKKHENSDKKPKGEKKTMTKAEIEAYKKKMMEREEARYLDKESKVLKDSRKSAKQVKPKASNPCKSNAKQNPNQKKELKKAPEKAVLKKAKAEIPRILQPLEPLYLLRIPGLPKGDCLAICYARGADA
jgi:hypothetical protein